MKRPRGFTLVEGLFTLFVVFLVLGIATHLLKEYTSILKSSAAKSSSLSSMQVALQQMLDDLKQATQVNSPPAGGSSADLSFDKVDPAAAWLPSPIPSPATAWDPLDPAMQLRVRYYLSNGNLLRDVGPIGSPTTWQVADRVGGLQVDDLGSGYQIRMTLVETHRALVITGFSARLAF